jgi:hypothetical protein
MDSFKHLLEGRRIRFRSKADNGSWLLQVNLHLRVNRDPHSTRIPAYVPFWMVKLANVKLQRIFRYGFAGYSLALLVDFVVEKELG